MIYNDVNMCACHPWEYYTVFCIVLYIGNVIIIIAIKIFHLNMTAGKFHWYLVSVLFGSSMNIENFLMTKYDIVTVNNLQCLHEKLYDREGIYDSWNTNPLL